MKMLINTVVALAAVATAGLATAADTKSADKAASPATASSKSPQQQKMKQCNADARGKKGDERKAFMKACLSKKADAPAS